MWETKLITFRYEKHLFCPCRFSVSQPSSPCGKMDASLQWQTKHQVLAALLQRMLSTSPISDTSLFPEAGMIFAAAAFPTLLSSAGHSPCYCLAHRSHFTRVLLGFLMEKMQHSEDLSSTNFFPFSTQLAPYFGINWGENLICTPCSSSPRRTRAHPIPFLQTDVSAGHVQGLLMPRGED